MVRPETPTSPLAILQRYGQSIWLDFLRRSLIVGGDLHRLVDSDGVTGVTSNPTIFEKAIDGSHDYTAAIEELRRESPDLPAEAVYERLATKDIQDVADLLQTVYAETAGRDGYVSFEVSPRVANDSEATIREARRLWRAVGRPNVMIKVPGTSAGIPAISALIAEGINVNVTLLFSRQRYEAVAEAYLDGLASVASFFVSRIDTRVDALLADKLKAAGVVERAHLERLLGKVAIANARLAYQSYKRIFSGGRWAALAAREARPQRLLWASTGVKNPRYRDVLYVEELIGPDTVNTMPTDTLSAFRDHGRPRASLEAGPTDALETLEELEAAGISLETVTDELLREGLRQFAEAFARLLATLERRCRGANAARINSQAYEVAPALATEIAARLAEWEAEGGTRRLFSGDHTLWAGSDDLSWIGWLSVVQSQLDDLAPLRALRAEVEQEGFRYVLLLGMGGSSLCPEVFKNTFGTLPGFPKLLVLDSTDPAQVRAVEQAIDVARTLFIVSSKSGSTLEPNIFKAYFFDRATAALGPDRAARHFIAVTDLGSKLETEARADGFRHIFPGVKSIGGRYSALSNFGMVPAAAMGLDVHRLLDGAERMLHACSPGVPAAENPGLVLGTILGLSAKRGIDKLTLVASPGLSDLGAWLEQLIAESTGKDGKGIIPIDREAIGTPDKYGPDRLFAYLRLDDEPDPGQDRAVAALETAGLPVVRIGVATRYEIGEEFVRWEIATAIAGALIGINPFNQPDVEASKIATRALTAGYQQTGRLPSETPFYEDRGVKLFADPNNAAALTAAISRSGAEPSLAAYLRAQVERLGAGDYFALLAFLPMNAAHEEALQRLRHLVRDRLRVATCLGFGPRFLHSTGQAYKGGPPSGVFLQITCDDEADLAIAGQAFTFGIVKAAQARGDLQVLSERNRRALRVHLGADVPAGLAALNAAVEEALRPAP